MVFLLNYAELGITALLMRVFRQFTCKLLISGQVVLSICFIVYLFGHMAASSDLLHPGTLQEAELDEAEAKPAKKAKTSEVDTSAAQGSTTIFIKNMPWSATEESIREFFAPAGEVVEVRIGVFFDRHQQCCISLASPGGNTQCLAA